MQLALKKNGSPMLLEATTREVEDEESSNLSVRFYLPAGLVHKISDGTNTQTIEFGEKQVVEEFEVGLS